MQKDLDFLLLGKTGYGKSALGNSILGRQAFSSKPSMTSVTFKSKKEITRLKNGRRLLVVDAPGLCDTGGGKGHGEKIFKDAIKEAMVMNPEGYHVFLLTLKYGNRLTNEDLETIRYMKKLFGEDFVQKYCIIIMTYGDIFKQDLKAEEKTFTRESFSEWCKAQAGEFKSLCEEVQERVLLFDNRCTPEEKESQLQDLLNMVNEKMLTGRRYTNKKFEKVLQSRHELLAEDKTILPVQNAQEEFSLLSNEIERIQCETSIDAKLSAFEQVTKKINTLLEKIDKEEYKSDALGRWRNIVADKQSYVVKEVLSLNLEKEIAEKNKQKKEFRVIQVLLDDQKRLTEELKKEQSRQHEEYIKARDESNNQQATSIWSKIKSWFSWSTA